MREVHFVNLGSVDGCRGWIAPIEACRDSPQVGRYVVPVQPDGRLFDHYRMGLVQYHGNGKTIPGAAMLDLQPSGSLTALINGYTVGFRLCTSESEPTIHDYVGKLSHPDFGNSLAEIEAESEEQLDDLYAQTRIVLVGCDPAASYGGMDSISLPSNASGRELTSRPAT